METLSIYLFGSSIRLTHHGEPIAQHLRPQARNLLAYLLLRSHRPQPRESLLDVFWHDFDEERARRCLSTTLWRLRSALEQVPVGQNNSLLIASHDEISLDPDNCCWVDVADFETRVGHALAQNPADMKDATVQDLELALGLYTGDLLETVYDEWALRERERLRLLYIRGLLQQMDFHFIHENYEHSLEAALKVLALDPLRETVHQKVMQIYAWTGHRSLALRQFAHCQTILQEELGIPPMAQTQELYAKIQAGQLGANAPGSETETESEQQVLKRLNLAMKELENAREQLSIAISLASCFDKRR